MTSSQWYNVHHELEPTTMHMDADWADQAMLSQLKSDDNNEKASSVVVEPTIEQQKEAERDRREEAERELRKQLDQRFTMLQEQCVLYMELDRQLSPAWLGDRFRALETDAKAAGFVDIKNKAAAQAHLIEMTGNRSATSSRLFTLLAPNETVSEYGPL